MKLTLERMNFLFGLLNKELLKRGVTGEVLVFGGSALTLGYRLRESTSDIDAIFEPKNSVQEAIESVSRKVSGLSRDWLNDGVKGFIFSIPPSFVVWAGSNLTVKSVTADYLLAMKMQSMRTDHKDEVEDVRKLILLLGLTTVDQVFEVVQKYVPIEMIPMRSRYVVMEIFQSR